MLLKIGDCKWTVDGHISVSDGSMLKIYDGNIARLEEMAMTNEVVGISTGGHEWNHEWNGVVEVLSKGVSPMYDDNPCLVIRLHAAIMDIEITGSIEI